MTADDLKRIRLSGKKPELIVCSFLGPLKNVPAPVMPVDGREDPRLFRGLDVILAHDGKNVDPVIEFADQLMQIGVEECVCWSVFEDLWVSVVSLGMKYISRVPGVF